VVVFQTALSAGTTAESRRPFRPDSGDRDDGEDEKRRKYLASPFPSDSILRNFARGRNANGLGAPIPDAGPSSSVSALEKKRKYLEMVTDPDRFTRYGTTGAAPSAGVTPISGAEVVTRKTAIPDTSDLFTRTSRGNSKPSLSVSSRSASPAVKSSADSLGARLGAAAMQNESLRQKAEQDRREREMELRRAQQEQERRLVENTRLRQDEVAERERAAIQRRRQQEEANARAAEERKSQEAQRLQEMMKAQEDYWTKRLAAERGKTMVQGAKEVLDPMEAADAHQAAAPDATSVVDSHPEVDPDSSSEGAPPVAIESDEPSSVGDDQSATAARLRPPPRGAARPMNAAERYLQMSQVSRLSL
jgi:hypothetical protein